FGGTRAAASFAWKKTLYYFPFRVRQISSHPVYPTKLVLKLSLKILNYTLCQQNLGSDKVFKISTKKYTAYPNIWAQCSQQLSIMHLRHSGRT
ncbi:MAG: hypothetical protein ABF760_07225, partial [Zymomonas mobilis]